MMYETKISTRLDALHAMCVMRRMELDDSYCQRGTDKLYDSMYAACERFFAENPSAVWERWENNCAW